MTKKKKKKTEETTILQRSNDNFNKLFHSPLPQQPVSTSRLVQDCNKGKWFTKELPRTQKCLRWGERREGEGGEGEKATQRTVLLYTRIPLGLHIFFKGERCG